MEVILVTPPTSNISCVGLINRVTQLIICEEKVTRLMPKILVMAENSPLSYQTTYPEYPDVSYEAWRSLYGNPSGRGSRFNDAATAFFRGDPSYESWRTNLLDRYNADLAAYNTWLSSGAGKRASAESGEYNPSYFDSGSPSASPLNFEKLDGSPGASEISQGIGTIMSFVSAVQGLAETSAKIRGIKLENEGKAIENRYMDSLLSGKASKLGFENDWLNLRNSTELYSRYKDSPELWKGGVFSPFGTMTYDLNHVDQGLMYQQGVKNLSFIDSGIALRNAQSAMQKWNAKEKEFYVTQIQGIEKDYLLGRNTLQNGEIDLQKIRLDLEGAARRAGIGGDVVRIILGLVSLFK